MHLFVDVFNWLTTSQHWSGPDGIPIRVLQHIGISVVSVVGAVIVAVPVGLFVGHKRRGEFIAVSIANIGRAVPSFAVLVLVFVFMPKSIRGLAADYGPGVVALVLLAIPPILTNAYVGVENVDPDTVEAARGMGMRERDVLLRLELPLASPLILASIRTAAVQVVATATLVALISGGGLGRFIVDGFAQGDLPMTVSGAVLIAVLAIATELTMALIQRLLTPRQVSKTRPPGMPDTQRVPAQLGPIATP